MSIWIIMIAAGLATYSMRLSFIQAYGRRRIPEWMRRSLRYVPPAVLTAIIFPELLMQDGGLEFSAGNFRLIAGVIAALVAWRTKNVMLTVVAGMAVLWVLQLIF